MSHQLIVAIGRESGSGGLDIAHALAERLQLPLFDKSILQKAAEGKGVSAETLERYDERPYSPPVLPLRPGHQQRPGGLRGPDAV